MNSSERWSRGSPTGTSACWFMRIEDEGAAEAGDREEGTPRRAQWNEKPALASWKFGITNQ